VIFSRKIQSLGTKLAISIVEFVEDIMDKKKISSQNDSALQVYFDQIKVIPLLDFEEEIELSKRIQQGDRQAHKKLVESNLRLVVKIARNYLSDDISFMDIIQEGNIGLMHAAEKYDHKRQVRFSTYASWWIRQSISRFLSNKRRPIRLPHRKEDLYRKIQKVYQSLTQTLMRKPHIEEIAKEIGVPVKDVEYVINMTNNFISLDNTDDITENSAALDRHEDYTYNPERLFMEEETHYDTLNFLNELKERERRILIYRYQLNGGEWHSLKKTGDKMGISPETVRQIEIRVLQKLRRQVEKDHGTMYQAM
jgi:RNA polymerase primary sigma factor